MKIKDTVKNIIYSIPILGNLLRENKIYKTHYPPGHYANPFPSLDEVKKYSNLLFDESKEIIPGVNLNIKNQNLLLLELFKAYPKIPYINEKNNLRYTFNNSMFRESDAIFLWLIIDYFKPRKIIEIGSGFSSAIMLDIIDVLLGGGLDLTFIDPYTEKLKKILKLTTTIM